MSVMELKDITKKFGKFVALDGVNLKLNQGEVLGFIGPNGAGKSTTIRIILGLLRKTGGEAKLFGKDPWKDAVDLHKRLAYVPGDVHLWPNLSGGEVIDLFGNLRGSMNTKRRTELIERFDLDPTKKCRTYSKGNRQKVALISAFSSDVDLFILDEPTSGLDPLMEMVFQDCVAEAKATGKTILLSSHILSEVERLCDRVSIIKKGNVVETGTLGELRHFTRNEITVETEREIVGLQDLQNVFEVSVKGKKAQFQVDSQNLDSVLRHLLPFEIKTLTSKPPSLEDLFMRHYGNEISSTQQGDRG
ncbi:ATP-binding cassette domain-containing protein [Alkalihalobacterium sp. APHAB7]|uniref:ABC transporter ATP-binding protein n=1 Tax=Alkalihalobacterium sp. APHAB7 TaxID=3402081 RepID=UPI003AAF093A